MALRLPLGLTRIPMEPSKEATWAFSFVDNETRSIESALRPVFEKLLCFASLSETSVTCSLQFLVHAEIDRKDPAAIEKCLGQFPAPLLMDIQGCRPTRWFCSRRSLAPSSRQELQRGDPPHRTR